MFESDFKDFIDLLVDYDPVDLIKSIAALQLCPENIDYILRFEAIIDLLVSNHLIEGKRLITSQELRELCNSDVILNSIALMEDPCTNSFADSLCTPIGPTIIFPSNYEEITYITRHISMALFCAPKPFPSIEFIEIAKKLYSALFMISTVVADRSGITRSYHVSNHAACGVFVPDDDRLRDLKNAITFHQYKMEFIIGHICPLSTISDLEFSFDSSSLYYRDTNDFSQIPKPIFKHVNEYVIAFPGALVPCCTAHLLEIANKLGVIREFQNRFQQAVWQNVIYESLHLMDIKPVDFLEKDTELNILEAVFYIDLDKAMYTCLLPPDFTETPENLDELPDTHKSPTETLLNRFLSIKQDILKFYPLLKTIVPLYLTQNMGIGCQTISFPKEIENTPVMHFNAGQINIISHLDAGDSLLIWKFFMALHDIENKCLISSSDMLDTYCIYRTNKHSFYLSDDPLPNQILIAPGSSEPLRREFLEIVDLHCISSSIPKHYCEVIKAKEFPKRKIYIFPNHRQNIIKYVTESLSPPVWAISPDFSENEKDWKQSSMYFRFCQAIVYWMDEVSESLTDLFKVLENHYKAITIQVKLPDYEIFEELETGDQIDYFELESDPLSGHLILKPTNLLGRVLKREDNEGERQMLKSILILLFKLISGETSEILSEYNVDDIIENHAPLGPKKMIHILDSSKEPEMLPIDDEYIRYVKEHDIGVTLDELREHLISDKHLLPSVIPKDERNNYINEIIVPFFSYKLNQLISTLSPDKLIEKLAIFHEALRYNFRKNRITTASRLASLEKIDGLSNAIRDEISEVSEAALSSLFLIEYIVAKPPDGTEDLTFSIYDTLLAYACHILNFGMISEQIYFGLGDDIALSILPSGRFGVGLGDHDIIRKQFFTEHSRENILNDYESVNARIFGDQRINEPEWIDQLDEAAYDEWGFSITMRSKILVEILAISIRESKEIACFEREFVIDLLQKNLKLDNILISDILDSVTLKPRPEIFTDDGVPREIWPWVQNRPESYKIKPILCRNKKGINELIWGPRQIITALGYHNQLLKDSRLRTEPGGPIEKVFGSIMDSRGNKFNDKVFEYLKLQYPSNTTSRVTTIGSIMLPSELGDIDVQVIDHATKHIYIIETKSLNVHYSAREIDNDIKAFYLNNDSTIMKHENRVLFYNENIKQICAELGLGDPEIWRIHGIIVVNRSLFANFVKETKLKVLSFQGLKEIIDLNHCLEPVI
jgi:hypothetical protein